MYLLHLSASDLDNTTSLPVTESLNLVDDGVGNCWVITWQITQPNEKTSDENPENCSDRSEGIKWVVTGVFANLSNDKGETSTVLSKLQTLATRLVVKSKNWVHNASWEDLECEDNRLLYWHLVILITLYTVKYSDISVTVVQDYTPWVPSLELVEKLGH